MTQNAKTDTKAEPPAKQTEPTTTEPSTETAEVAPAPAPAVAANRIVGMPAGPTLQAGAPASAILNGFGPGGFGGPGLPAKKDTKPKMTEEEKLKIEAENPIQYPTSCGAVNPLPHQAKPKTTGGKAGVEKKKKKHKRMLLKGLGQKILPSELVDKETWAVPFDSNTIQALKDDGWDPSECTFLTVGEGTDRFLYTELVKVLVNKSCGSSLEIQKQSANNILNSRSYDPIYGYGRRGRRGAKKSNRKKSNVKLQLKLGLGLHEVQYDPNIPTKQDQKKKEDETKDPEEEDKKESTAENTPATDEAENVPENEDTASPEESDVESDSEKPVETIKVLHSVVGAPQAGQIGMLTFRQLTLFVKGTNRGQFFKRFGEYIYTEARSKKDNLVKMYRWSTQSQYWMSFGSKVPRTMDSVVLPKKLKNSLNNDMKSFLSEKTENFYHKHGIPYKRSYLFRGKPGAGKTSLIEALAGQHERNLCQLVLAVPKMTDDMFAQCLCSIPEDSIICLEDIDALFSRHRERENTGCPLTFSAVLNGLDGLASPSAQIFIMTTNYPNRLDPALVRSGRVDVHIEFKDACTEQMEQIFMNFYEDEKKLSKDFAKAVNRHKKGGISMASLQQHFVRHMNSDAQACVDAVKEEISMFQMMESGSCMNTDTSVYG